MSIYVFRHLLSPIGDELSLNFEWSFAMFQMLFSHNIENISS